MPVESLARFIAAHAEAFFLGAFIVSLAAAAGMWWAADRFASRVTRFVRARMPARYFVLHFSAGFALIVGMIFAFVALADETMEDEALSRFDIALASELRGALSPELLRFFAHVTNLADPFALTVLCTGVAVALLAWRQAGLASIWVLAVAGNGALNRVLKAVFERVRPLHDHGLATADGWSFPSGHSSGAVAAYGMLAYLLVRATPLRRHLAIVLCAIGVILLVGLSRMALQLHFFSDVMAGYASGAAWLTMCIAGAEMLRARAAQAAEIRHEARPT